MKRNLLFLLCLVILCSCEPKTYKFAVLCDTRSDAEKNGKLGVNVSAIKAVCAHLKADGAEFVLAPGDFICGNVSWYSPQPPSNDDQYQSFLEAAQSAGVGLPGSGENVILYPVRGNHECYQNILPGDSIRASWKRHMGNLLPQNGPEDELGLSYSFEHKGALFIALDQYAHASDSQKEGIGINQEWLNEELDNHPNAKHVFTFGHTPAFAAKHQDCLGEDSIARNQFLQSIENRSGVYFCGHDHFYARSNIPVYADNGDVKSRIQQVITPSGAPFLTGSRDDNQKWDGQYKNKDVNKETYIDNSLGYQLVTVTGNKVTVEYIATFDASTFKIDDKGVYHYTFNENWEKWNFAILDRFSYEIPYQMKQ